jgi:hypothetical protein
MSVLNDLGHIPVFLRSPESGKTDGIMSRFDKLDKTREYDFEIVMRNNAVIPCPFYKPEQFISLFTTNYDLSGIRSIRAVLSLPDAQATS